MLKVENTPQSRQDLSDIFQYLADYDLEIAKKFLLLIDEKCELLAKFPGMGRTRHELLINLRSFPVKNYVVFYTPIEYGIEVFRILHSSRDITEVFNETIEEAEKIN